MIEATAKFWMLCSLVSTVILFLIFVNVVVHGVRATLKLTGIIWKGTKLKTIRIFNFSHRERTMATIKFLPNYIFTKIILIYCSLSYPFYLYSFKKYAYTDSFNSSRLSYHSNIRLYVYFKRFGRNFNFSAPRDRGLNEHKVNMVHPCLWHNT